MANSPTNIETLVQRALSLHLRQELPEAVTVTRALIPAPPEADRVTVLPGEGQATTTVAFLGNATRAVRDDRFMVRTWVEVLGDDQDEVEDRADAYVAIIENVAAENAGLDDIDGLIAFAQDSTRSTHPMLELTPGLFYRWVEVELSVDARYD